MANAKLNINSSQLFFALQKLRLHRTNFRNERLGGGGKRVRLQPEKAVSGRENQVGQRHHGARCQLLFHQCQGGQNQSVLAPGKTAKINGHIYLHTGHKVAIQRVDMAGRAGLSWEHAAEAGG